MRYLLVPLDRNQMDRSLPVHILHPGSRLREEILHVLMEHGNVGTELGIPLPHAYRVYCMKRARDRRVMVMENESDPKRDP